MIPSTTSWKFWPDPDPEVIGDNVYSWNFLLKINLPIVVGLIALFSFESVRTWTGADPRIFIVGALIQIGVFAAVIAYGHNRIPVGAREVMTHIANLTGAVSLPLSSDEPLFLLWVVFLMLVFFDAYGNIKSVANFLITVSMPFLSLAGHMDGPHANQKVLMAVVLSALGGVVYLLAAYIADWTRVGALAMASKARESGAREERKRLERGLNATLGATLSEISLWHEVALASDVEGAQTASLTKARTKAREALTELSELVAGFDQQPAKMAGVAGEIQRRAGSLCAAAGIRFDMDFGAIGNISLSEGYHITMVAIEAVENAVAHAKPSRVSVFLSGAPLGVIVEDDGAGFDLATVYHGRGLRNLEILAAALKGPLEIDSALGKGTRVRVFAAH